MTQSRQLAAIMFTDIVGYTALMEQDEKKAFEVLKKNLSIHKAVINEFRGRLIKELGDGILASFSNVSDALNAAIKIQKQCNEADEFKLSIGIHQGEVVFENEDVFGGAVNVASRIQTLGSGGSILFSKKITDEVKNKTEFQTVSLGSFEFKNVNEPIEVFALANDGFPVPRRNKMTGKLKKNFQKRNVIAAFTIILLVLSYFVFPFLQGMLKQNDVETDRSIAVLPFVDMTPQGDMEYLGDGLAEEIINSLTSIRELKVIGRTSSFQFKGEKLDLREVGKKLQVGIILEGSIQKFEDHFRITAQLVRTKDNFHIWSERYDLEQTNIFKIQDNIAANIVDKLRLTLTAMEKKRIIKKEIDQVTYNFYLQGLYQYKAEKFAECIPYMSRVIQLDSTYAPAYAYMGLSKAWVAFNADRGEDASAVNESLFYAQRSVELDPDLAEGYSAIGFISWTLQRDYAKARTYFDKSIEVNPAPAPSYILNRYGYLLIWMGDFEKASQLALKAMRLDPVDYNSYAVLYFSSLYAGRFDEAEHYLNERKRIFGQNRGMISMEIRLSFAQDEFEKVVQKCDSLVSSGSSLVAFELSQLARAYLKLNRLSDSDSCLIQLKAMVVDRNNDAYFPTALIYADRHEMDSCFAYLEMASQRREQMLKTLKIEPALKELHKDPRFIKLYQDNGFDKY